MTEMLACSHEYFIQALCSKHFSRMNVTFSSYGTFKYTVWTIIKHMIEKETFTQNDILQVKFGHDELHIPVNNLAVTSYSFIIN